MNKASKSVCFSFFQQDNLFWLVEIYENSEIPFQKYIHRGVLKRQIFAQHYLTLRLGAQNVTLLSTLRDLTQLRQRQCATRQHPFVAHQKEGIDHPKEVQHHIGGGQQQKNVRNPLNSRIWVRSIPSFWWAIRIWVFCFQTSHRVWSTAKNTYEIL